MNLSDFALAQRRVFQHPHPFPVKDRLRQAVALTQQKDFDGARNKLQPVPAEPMLAARFHDAQGDVFAAEQKPQEAREAWQSALDLLAANGVTGQDPRQTFIRLKLESISGS